MALPTKPPQQGASTSKAPNQAPKPNQEANGAMEHYKSSTTGGPLGHMNGSSGPFQGFLKR